MTDQAAIDDFLDARAAQPAAAAPSTISEIWNANYDAAGLSTFTGGRLLEEQRQKLSDAIEGEAGQPIGDYARSQGIALGAGRFDDNIAALGDLARTLPEDAQKRLAPLLDVRRNAQQQAQQLGERAAQVNAGAYGLTPNAVRFAAGLARQAVDPGNVAAMVLATPFGGPESAGLLGMFAREAAAGAAIQAAQEPVIQARAAELGIPHGFYEGAEDVADAGVAGGILGTGLALVLRAGANAIRSARRSQPIASPEISAAPTAAPETRISEPPTAAAGPPDLSGLKPQVDTILAGQRLDPWTELHGRLLSLRLSQDAGMTLPVTDEHAIRVLAEEASLKDRQGELAARLGNLPPGDEEAATRLSRLEEINAQASEATGAARKALLERRDALLADTNPEALRAAAAPLEQRRAIAAEQASIAARLADIEKERAKLEPAKPVAGAMMPAPRWLHELPLEPADLDAAARLAERNQVVDAVSPDPSAGGRAVHGGALEAAHAALEVGRPIEETHAVAPAVASDGARAPIARPSELARTGDLDVDAILASSPTRDVIDHPVVDRAHSIPYTAGGSVPLSDPTTFIDERFPRSFTIDSITDPVNKKVTFDPATPFTIHENAEEHAMDILIKGGMEPAAAYRFAHFEIAEAAEHAWYRAMDIDQDKAEAAYAPHMARIQEEGAPNVPDSLYKRPYPHDTPSAARHEAIAEPGPSEAEIKQARAILQKWREDQTKGSSAAAPAPAAPPVSEMPLPQEGDAGAPIRMPAPARRAVRGPRAKPLDKRSLFEFIAANGGIRDDDKLIGDVRQILDTRNFVPGFGAIIRKYKQLSSAALRGGRSAAKSLDEMREAAVIAGYLHDPEAVTGQGSTTVNDLLELMDREARGNRVYPWGNEPEGMPEWKLDQDRELRELRAELEQKFDQELAGVGVDPKSIGEGVRARMVEIVEREGEKDMLLAYERAAMENDETEAPDERRETSGPIPDWDTPDERAAPQAREGAAGEAPGARQGSREPGEADRGAGGEARAIGDQALARDADRVLEEAGGDLQVVLEENGAPVSARDALAEAEEDAVAARELQDCIGQVEEVE